MHTSLKPFSGSHAYFKCANIQVMFSFSFPFRLATTNSNFFVVKFLAKSQLRDYVDNVFLKRDEEQISHAWVNFFNWATNGFLATSSPGWSSLLRFFKAYIINNRTLQKTTCFTPGSLWVLILNFFCWHKSLRCLKACSWFVNKLDKFLKIGQMDDNWEVVGSLHWSYTLGAVICSVIRIHYTYLYHHVLGRYATF